MTLTLNVIHLLIGDFRLAYRDGANFKSSGKTTDKSISDFALRGLPVVDLHRVVAGPLIFSFKKLSMRHVIEQESVARLRHHFCGKCARSECSPGIQIGKSGGNQTRVIAMARIFLLHVESDETRSALNFAMDAVAQR